MGLRTGLGSADAKPNEMNPLPLVSHSVQAAPQWGPLPIPRWRTRSRAQQVLTVLYCQPLSARSGGDGWINRWGGLPSPSIPATIVGLDRPSLPPAIDTSRAQRNDPRQDTVRLEHHQSSAWLANVTIRVIPDLSTALVTTRPRSSLKRWLHGFFPLLIQRGGGRALPPRVPSFSHPSFPPQRKHGPPVSTLQVAWEPPLTWTMTWTLSGSTHRDRIGLPRSLRNTHTARVPLGCSASLWYISIGHPTGW